MESKIHIPNPCQENWNSMTPNKKGKFCHSCSKTVIDFTKMKDPEIQKYFIQNNGNELICGYFKLNQIESESSNRYHKLRKKFNQIKIKPIKQMALFSLSILFTMSSCMMGKVAEPEPSPTEKDLINENEIIDKSQNPEIVNDSINSETIQIKKEN